MNQINQVTDDAKQKHKIQLADGSLVTLMLEYKPQQVGWFINQLTWQGFEVNNLRITTGANVLHQYKNSLPFGIGCFVDMNQEPTLQNDFLTGRAKLYILDQADIDLFEEVLSGQVQS